MNTRKNSTKVYCVSITLLLSFEWGRKTLKLQKSRPLETEDGAPADLAQKLS